MFKSGDVTNIINHRLIFIINYLKKLFESIILSSIQRPDYGILIDEQNGFEPGCFIRTCNEIFTNYVLDVFDNHSQVDVVYTAFTKTFDRGNLPACVKISRALKFGEELIS